MRVMSNLDLEQGGVKSFCFGDQADYPLLPKAGSCILKDKRLMLCVEVGDLPIWIPITQEMGMYTHTQSSELSRWTISHGLNVGRPIIQCFDAEGDVVNPSNIRCVDANSVEVTMPLPMTGVAVVIAGTSDGLPHIDVGFSMDITEAALTWVIPHSLGYVPGIRVYVNNHEVQPASITHDGTSSSTITFSTPQKGRVVCI